MAKKKLANQADSSSKKETASSKLAGKNSLQRAASRDSDNSMNLAVLKRKDSSIKTILDKSSHVVTYQFDLACSEWKKKGVEGSLMVFKRSKSPKYGFFILNRRGVENIFEVIDPQLQFKYEKPYLLYKTKSSGIIGIWFYAQDEQYRISSLLTKLSIDTDYNEESDPSEENADADQNNISLLDQLNQSLQDKQIMVDKTQPKTNISGSSTFTESSTNTATPLKNNQYGINQMMMYQNMLNMSSPYNQIAIPPNTQTPPQTQLSKSDAFQFMTPTSGPPMQPNITPSRLNFDSPSVVTNNATNSGIHFNNLIQDFSHRLELDNKNHVPKNMNKEQFKNYLMSRLLHDQIFVDVLFNQYLRRSN